jgi:hypothetical protein
MTRFVCGVLSMIGLFGCAASGGPDRGPASEAAVETVVSEDASELAGGCCIDYYCGSLDVWWTGCKLGAGPSIREALDACNAACPELCASGGMYCD